MAVVTVGKRDKTHLILLAWLMSSLLETHSVSFLFDICCKALLYSFLGFSSNQEGISCSDEAIFSSITSTGGLSGIAVDPTGLVWNTLVSEAGRAKQSFDLEICKACKLNLDRFRADSLLIAGGLL
jgi:hypothetical protein